MNQFNPVDFINKIADHVDTMVSLLFFVMICCICSCVSNCNRNDKLDRIEAALSQIATAEKGAAK